MKRLDRKCACCGRRVRKIKVSGTLVTDSGQHSYEVCARCAKLPTDEMLARVELRLGEVAGNA